MVYTTKRQLKRDYPFIHITPEMYWEYVNTDGLIRWTQFKDRVPQLTRTFSMLRIMLISIPGKVIKSYSRYMYFLELYTELINYILDLDTLCFPCAISSTSLDTGSSGVIYGFSAESLNYYMK